MVVALKDEQISLFFFFFVVANSRRKKKRKSSLARNPEFQMFWTLNKNVFNMIIRLTIQELSRYGGRRKWPLIKVKTLDSKLKEQIMKERHVWRLVLTRLLDVVKFLTKLNLPFRGHLDVYTSRKGNFIALVEFMSKYDPVFEKHYL